MKRSMPRNINSTNGTVIISRTDREKTELKVDCSDQ